MFCEFCGIQFRQGLFGLLVLVLTACSSSDDPATTSSGTGSADSVQPTAAITFPTAKSLSDGETVTVRGTANDNVAVTSVSVNGVAATSTDGFATWLATIPVEMGVHDITVTADDAAGNTNSTAATVEMTGIARRLENPILTVFDSESNRLYIFDNVYVALFSVDLDTNEIQVLSNVGVPDDSLPFFSPRDMVLDSGNNRIIMVDNKVLVSIDLDSGERTIFSSNTIPNNTNPFLNPEALALDADNNRVFVVDRKNGFIDEELLSVNLTTGARTVVSDPSSPNAGVASFGYNTGLAYDANTGWAFIVNRDSDYLLRVNVGTGDREILSDATTPNSDNAFISLGKIELDSANSRLFVYDRGHNAVLSVSLSNGARSIFFDAAVVETGGQSSFIGDIVLDSVNDRLWAVDRLLPGVFSIDLATADSTVLISEDAFDTGLRAERLTYDAANSRLLVTDRSTDTLLAIDMAGNRTVISGDGFPDGVNPFNAPAGVVLDEDNNRALVANTNSNSLMSVNLSTGVRTIISDNTLPNADNPFGLIFDFVYDAESNRAFVVDAFPQALLSVDLDSGARTVITDENTTNGLDADIGLEGVALDIDNNRVFMTTYGVGSESVLEVNLSNGVATVLSDNTTPNTDNPFVALSDALLDADNDRLFVTDWAGFLFTVDISSGERTMISGPNTPSSASLFGAAQSVALDLENNRAFVTDYRGGDVYVVDLTDGQRVIFAH